MRKSFTHWQLAGFFFTGSSGAVLHFLYDWSGKNGLVAAFSAVNESTWEHMKLLFFPMLLFSSVEYLFWGERIPNFWFTKAVGTLVGLALIPALFYTWNGVFGSSPHWVNIGIFFVAAAAVYVLECRLFGSGKGRGRFLQGVSLLLLLVLTLAFILWTYAPPDLPLFRDPVTGGYGIET